MTNQEMFEQCISFHGHSCPGLAIGVRAAIEAKRILGIEFSEDEEIVCITENDACGVDGIQVILGCSVGKGNLIFRMRGKQAYSFFNRKNGQSVRLVLKAIPNANDREAKQKFILEGSFEEVFDQMIPQYGLPEEARIFQSVACEICGESTAEPYVRLDNGKMVCLDCFNDYHRVD